MLLRSQAPLAPAPRATDARLALSTIAIACALVPHARAADLAPTATPAALVAADARLRLGAERLRLPGSERMGLVGLSELFNVADTQWWFGPAVYGAATGRRGGLFVPGVEGAWSHPFNDWLALDAGLFAGGGGGAAAPVGGGLMLRPHVDLVLRLPGFYTGPTWSSVHFVNGSIRSNQVGWMLTFDSSFRYRPADLLGRGTATDGSATGLGFDHVDAFVTRERPRDSRLIGGAPMTASVGLVGLRAERVVDGPLFAGIETAGAASGGVAGYAEVLGTAGLRFPVLGDRLSLGLRGAAGLGGGGSIDTGGGVLLKAAAGATLRVTDTLGLGLEAGLVDAPKGNFKARSASVSLNWSLDAPAHAKASLWNSPAADAATRMEFSSGAERYRAARKDGRSEALDAVTLSINPFVGPVFYVSGQAHSAFAGGAGAYSVGLFGAGAQVPVAPRLRLGAEALAGAAGGGGVDTRGGAVMQARAYADLALTDKLSVRLGAGRIRSVHGGLDAPTVDAAIVFRFGVDRAR